MDIAFFETLTPYWVDLQNSLHTAGFRIYYIWGQLYSYDSDILKQKIVFEPEVLEDGGKNALRMGELVHILRQERPKTVISVEYSALTLQLLLLRPFFGYRLITRCDDSFALTTRPMTKLHRWATRLLAPFVDDVILCDKSTLAFYKEKYSKGVYFPIIRDEVKYRTDLLASLHISNEFKSAYIPQDAKVVLYVGRLVPIKNVGAIIDALACIRENTVLIVVGEGEERSALEARARDKAVRAHFTGLLNGRDLYAWYNVADVFVLPSTMEPFGAVVNEALLSGCRCVVSELAGSAGLISESNGSLVDPYSLQSIKDAISRELSKVEYLPECRLKDNLMPFAFEEIMTDLKNALSL